jgi:hypothetical protein
MIVLFLFKFKLEKNDCLILVQVQVLVRVPVFVDHADQVGPRDFKLQTCAIFEFEFEWITQPHNSVFATLKLTFAPLPVPRYIISLVCASVSVSTSVDSTVVVRVS